jgi:hypothetical protein
MENEYPADVRITITAGGAEKDIHPSQLNDYLKIGWKIVPPEVIAARVGARSV